MKIHLQKKDVEKMLEIMNKFPQDTNYQIDYNASAGLGYNLVMCVNVSIKGHQGEFRIPVTDESNW